MSSNHNYYFFWAGFCSQWSKSEFTEYGETFNCAEQFMMAAKAKVFGDEAAYTAIMATQSPREQKTIGRAVKCFNATIWDDVAKPYVTLGNINKFQQNSDLRSHLEGVKDRYFVEASPYDCVWGVGLKASDPLIMDSANWRGTNWLGDSLNLTADWIFDPEKQHLIDALRERLDWTKAYV